LFALPELFCDGTSPDGQPPGRQAEFRPTHPWRPLALLRTRLISSAPPAIGAPRLDCRVLKWETWHTYTRSCLHRVRSTWDRKAGNAELSPSALWTTSDLGGLRPTLCFDDEWGDMVAAVDYRKEPPSLQTAGGQGGSRPWGVRLDAPGALYPGIVRGIARRRIVAAREEGLAIVARHVGVSTSGLPPPSAEQGSNSTWPTCPQSTVRPARLPVNLLPVESGPVAQHPIDQNCVGDAF
jgi:hypothetical protein